MNPQKTMQQKHLKTFFFSVFVLFFVRKLMTAETPQTGIPLSVAIKRCIFHLNLVFFLFFFFLLGFWAVGGT